MIFSFKGFTPVIDPTSFIHPLAAVTGNVIIGKHVYIGPGAAVRGDWGKIIIHDGCNIQENCTIHMFPGVDVVLNENAHIGHGAIIHGAQIGKNVLIGMNAVVMDNVTIEDECIIGALTFIKSGLVIERRSLVVGNPGRRAGEVSDAMLEWKKKGTRLYQMLPSECQESLKETDPCAQPTNQSVSQKKVLKPWNEEKSG